MHWNLKEKVLAIFIVFVGLTATIAYGEYICGDANSDGTINVSDAVFLINYIFVGGTAPNPNCCDDCPPTVTDYDGNVYQTVLLGDQCWMMENLKVTHYRNGDSIPNVTDDGAWKDLFQTSTGAYCNYDNDEGHVATYGRFYNFYAVADLRNIAPEGWHVPSDAEWKQLEMYLGMSQAEADASGLRGTDEGGKLKEAGIAHWLSPNTGATNESGFTGLPGGYRSADEGFFNDMGYNAVFWTTTKISTVVWYRNLAYDHSQVNRYYGLENYGLSVRCVRDQ